MQSLSRLAGTLNKNQQKFRTKTSIKTWRKLTPGECNIEGYVDTNRKVIKEQQNRSYENNLINQESQTKIKRKKVLYVTRYRIPILRPKILWREFLKKTKQPAETRAKIKLKVKRREYIPNINSTIGFFCSENH